ncbi:hypothetical protein DFH09DRAFT_1090659 [Mycena vulgaris]|nr:hypothetical protein DFH09DRAFT_1090659 [Mycena vulgaris]
MYLFDSRSFNLLSLRSQNRKEKKGSPTSIVLKPRSLLVARNVKRGIHVVLDNVDMSQLNLGLDFWYMFAGWKGRHQTNEDEKTHKQLPSRGMASSHTSHKVFRPTFTEIDGQLEEVEGYNNTVNAALAAGEVAGGGSDGRRRASGRSQSSRSVRGVGGRKFESWRVKPQRLRSVRRTPGQGPNFSLRIATETDGTSVAEGGHIKGTYGTRNAGAKPQNWFKKLEPK